MRRTGKLGLFLPPVAVVLTCGLALLLLLDPASPVPGPPSQVAAPLPLPLPLPSATPAAIQVSGEPAETPPPGPPSDDEARRLLWDARAGLEERRRALRRLLAGDTSFGRGELLRLVEDPEQPGELRRLALAEVALTGRSELLPDTALLALARRRDEALTLRTAAVQALGKRPAANRLLCDELLGCREEALRGPLAAAIATHGGEQALAALEAAAATVESRRVGGSIARAAARICRRKGLPLPPAFTALPQGGARGLKVR